MFIIITLINILLFKISSTDAPVNDLEYNQDLLPSNNGAQEISEEIKKYKWKSLFDSLVSKFCPNLDNHIDDLANKLQLKKSETSNIDKKDIIKNFNNEMKLITISQTDLNNYIDIIKSNLIKNDSCSISSVQDTNKYIKLKINDYENDINDEYKTIKHQWKMYCDIIKENIHTGIGKDEFTLKQDYIDILRLTFASMKYTRGFYEDENKINFKKILEKVKTNEKIPSNIRENKLKFEIIICHLKTFEDDLNLMNEDLDKKVGEALQFEYIKDSNCDLEENIRINDLISALRKSSIFSKIKDPETYKEAIEIYKNFYAKATNYIEPSGTDDFKQIFFDSNTCLINKLSDQKLNQKIKDIVEQKLQSDSTITRSEPDKWKSICKYYKKYISYRSLSSKETSLPFDILKRIIEIFVRDNVENGKVKDSLVLNKITETIKEDETVKNYISSDQAKLDLVECEISKLNNLDIINEDSKLETVIKTIGFIYSFDESCAISEPSKNEINKYESLKSKLEGTVIRSDKTNANYIVYLLYQIYNKDNQEIKYDDIKKLLDSLYLKKDTCIYTKNEHNILEQDYSSVNNLNIVLKWKYACSLLKMNDKFDNGYKDFITNNIENIISIYVDKMDTNDDELNIYTNYHRAVEIVKSDILNELLLMCKIKHFKSYNIFKDKNILNDIANEIIFDFPAKDKADLTKPIPHDITELKEKLKKIDSIVSNIGELNREILLEDYIYIFYYYYIQNKKINDETFNNLIRGINFDNDKCKFVLGDEVNLKKDIMSKIEDIKNEPNLQKLMEYKYARELYFLLKDSKDVKENEGNFEKTIYSIIINKLLTIKSEQNNEQIYKEIIYSQDIIKIIGGKQQLKAIIKCNIDRVSKYKFFTDKDKRKELSRILVNEFPTNEQCELDKSETDIKHIITYSLEQDAISKSLTDNEKSDMINIYQYFYNLVDDSLYNNKWKGILEGMLINLKECKIKSFDPYLIKNKLFEEIYNSYYDNIDSSLANVLHDVCKSYKIVNYYTSDDINNYLSKDIRIIIIKEYILLKYYSVINNETKVKIDIKETLLNNIKTNKIVSESLKMNTLEDTLIICHINYAINSEIINNYDILKRIINMLSYAYLSDNSKCVFSEYSTNDLILMRDIFKESNIFSINNDINYQIAIDVFEVYYKLSNVTLNEKVFKKFANSMIEPNECKIRTHDDDYTKHIIMDILHQNREDFDNKEDIELIKVICYLRKREEYYYLLLGDHGTLADNIKSKISSLFIQLRESFHSGGEIDDEKAETLLQKIKHVEEIKSIIELNEIYESLILCEIKISDNKLSKKKKSGVIVGVTVFTLILICCIAAALFLTFNQKK